MIVVRAGLICLALLGATFGAYAGSGGFIDCAKVEKSDEKTICADIKLIQEDARMVTLYKIATGLVGMGARGDLQDAQVGWLETRHACKEDAVCIRAAYGSRVERLQKVIDGIAARGPF